MDEREKLARSALRHLISAQNAILKAKSLGDPRGDLKLAHTDVVNTYRWLADVVAFLNEDWDCEERAWLRASVENGHVVRL